MAGAVLIIFCGAPRTFVLIDPKPSFVVAYPVSTSGIYAGTGEGLPCSLRILLLVCPLLFDPAPTSMPRIIGSSVLLQYLRPLN